MARLNTHVAALQQLVPGVPPTGPAGFRGSELPPAGQQPATPAMTEAEIRAMVNREIRRVQRQLGRPAPGSPPPPGPPPPGPPPPGPPPPAPAQPSTPGGLTVQPRNPGGRFLAGPRIGIPPPGTPIPPGTPTAAPPAALPLYPAASPGVLPSAMPVGDFGGNAKPGGPLPPAGTTPPTATIVAPTATVVAPTAQRVSAPSTPPPGNPRSVGGALTRIGLALRGGPAGAGIAIAAVGIEANIELAKNLPADPGVVALIEQRLAEQGLSLDSQTGRIVALTAVAIGPDTATIAGSAKIKQGDP